VGGHQGGGEGGAPATGSGGHGSGGAGPGGATGSGGAKGGTGGIGVGGTPGGAGGTGTGGGTTGTGGAGAGGVTGAGGGAAAWTCPAGSFTGTIPTGSAATRIAGAPPNDTFNNNGNDFTNVEGPVWIGDALYFSEMKNAPNPPQTRILKITAADVVTIAVPPDSGSNGMAVDAAGNLVTANHGVGGIVSFSLPAFTRTTLVSMYTNGMRFNSPNDLTIRNDGTIYFSDPTFQAPSPAPQSAQRVYMLPAGSGSATAIVNNASNPNGVALSLDQKFLFVGDGSGVMRYALNTDGTLMGAGAPIDAADLANNATDGMAIDCAGNLYVVRVNQHDIIVVKDPTGTATKTGQITIPGAGNLTNVAFGGTDHKTLYVTAQGTGIQRGVFKLAMPLPGMPY
jgi:gluconolactonase